METRIEGEFKLISNENFFEYLTALGVPSQQAKIVDSLKPTLSISLNETEVMITTTLKTSVTTSILKINEEVEEQLAGLIVVKSLTTVGNDDFTISSKGPQGEAGRRHFDFFEDGLIMTLSSDNKEVPVAQRFYKRVKPPSEIETEEKTTEL